MASEQGKAAETWVMAAPRLHRRVRGGSDARGSYLGTIVTLAFLVLLAFGSVSGHAKTAAVKIRLLAAGGLLGQRDGMPRYPGGSFNVDSGPGIHPYGGLEGLLDWLKEPTHSRPDLFLLTANNQPLDIGLLMHHADRPQDYGDVTRFWDRVRVDLKPDAIGIGTEDFLRALAFSGSAGTLAAWLRGELPWAPKLPFVASNAAVRLHAPQMNHVSDLGFTLHVDAAASVGWLKDVAFTFPCGATGFRATLIPAEAGRRVRATTEPKISGGECHGHVSFSKVLQPGQAYTLQLGTNDQVDATFRFRTDELLTSMPAIVPEQPALPIIIGLVDPNVRAMLADDKWRWRGGGCAADSCEIVLMPPIEAFEDALDLVGADAGARPVAVLSSLKDSDTLAVVQHSQRIRFVVFPPDSTALGRAAERRLRANSGGAGGQSTVRANWVPPPYSGALGYGAVLNPSTPEVTQIWSRPEWYGETVQEMAADVTPDQDQNPWRLESPEHVSESVPGRALCAIASGADVKYYLETPSEDVKTFTGDGDVIATAARYPDAAPIVPYDQTVRIRQDRLWTDVDAFAAMALNVMRDGLNTELALLPVTMIDENWLVYLRRDRRAPTQALSRVILDRVLFRAGEVVRVRVLGSALLETVNKMLSAGRSDDVDYCLSGFGTTNCGVSKLDRERTLLNGRGIYSNRFYTIAMPEAVAVQSGLAPYGETADHLVTLIDNVFTRHDVTADSVNTCASTYQNSLTTSNDNGLADDLPMRLERAAAAQHSGYLFMKPAELSFSQTQVNEPPDGEGLFNKLPIPNNRAKPNQHVALNLGVDWGIFDARRFLVRALSTIGYGRAVVNGQTSTDPNVATVALHVAWRLPAAGMRVFAGPAYESEFGDQVTLVQAGPGGPTLPLVTARQEFTYVGAGFELERSQRTSWLTIDPLRVTMAFGESGHQPVDVTINGASQGLEPFARLGAEGLLAQYASENPNLIASSTPYAFVYRSVSRDRIQAEATPVITFAIGGKNVDLGLATSFLWWTGRNAEPLSERQSLSMRLWLAIPFAGRATVNLNASEYLVQVIGVSGWFNVWAPSVSISVPIVFTRRAGWTF
jgi:hypothetical protein